MTFSDDRAVDLLAEMLRTPSLCGQENAVATILQEVMADAGFEVHRDDAGNVIGTIGGTARPDSRSRVVILGHMDTVPGSIPVQQRDNSLYGRGAVDAKGPLAAAVVAAARAAGRTQADVTVVGAVQEEGPSVGARHLVESDRPLPPPDYLVIAEPSGWDAIVLGYKGSQRFTVQIAQPCAHTAGPEPTAPERGVAFWNDLVAWCESVSVDTPSSRRGVLHTPALHTGAPHGPGGGYPLTPNPSPSVGEGSVLHKTPPLPRRERGPGGEGIAEHGPDRFNSLTATLISFDSRSDGLEDRVDLHIGLRLPPGLTREEVESGVRALLPHGTFCFAAGEAAVRAEKSTPLVPPFLRSIRSEGGRPRFKLKTGTSDMNVVGPVWGCPMVAYGPGDSILDHRPDEHIRIDEYLSGIRVLTRVLEEL